MTLKTIWPLSRRQILVLVLLLLVAVYYLVVLRPSAPYAFYKLGRARWKSFEPKFLSTWADALNRKEVLFTYNDRTYSSSTGKAHKS